MSEPEIVVLDGAAAKAATDELADVLIDCVEGGASVSFMLPLDRPQATAFFGRCADAVARGDTVMIAARLDGRIVGTVQLGVATSPNQPHRGDVMKMLVHRGARRRGIAALLMQRLEQEARERGRTVLVLDTAVGGDAERVYARAGWTRVGEVPDYALWPAGGYCATAFYWKRV